jgi:hypothetical protein
LFFTPIAPNITTAQNKSSTLKQQNNAHSNSMRCYSWSDFMRIPTLLAYLRTFIQSLVLLVICNVVSASELLPLVDDLKPSENGLPPPLEKPLNISVCLFDMQGKNGDFYSRAKDLALIARR